MKKLIFLSLLATANFVYSQSYLTVGAHKALPQNQLRNAGYSDGYGGSIGWMSGYINLKPGYDLQLGISWDISGLGHKNFSAKLNTPVPDNGKIKVQNESFGFYGVIRGSREYERMRPYADFVFGPRTYNTTQTVTAENPSKNPEYEKETKTEAVVFTTRFHYGVAGGSLFKITDAIWLDLGFTYTLGTKGAVQPLKNVIQEGNELRYNYKSVNTDILLLRMGFIFELDFSNNWSNPSGFDGPDNNYQNNNNNNNQRQQSTPSTPSKKQIEIKPNPPPKSGNH